MTALHKFAVTKLRRTVLGAVLESWTSGSSTCDTQDVQAKLEETARRPPARGVLHYVHLESAPPILRGSGEGPLVRTSNGSGPQERRFVECGCGIQEGLPEFACGGAGQHVFPCHAFEANATFLDSAVTKLRPRDEYAGVAVAYDNFRDLPYRPVEGPELAGMPQVSPIEDTRWRQLANQSRSPLHPPVDLSSRLEQRSREFAGLVAVERAALIEVVHVDVWAFDAALIPQCRRPTAPRSARP